MGTALLTALLVGLLTAFAFHLLLTCFGLAIGMTALGFQLNPSASVALNSTAKTADQQDTIAETSSKKSAPNISFWVGLGLLLSTNSVLFSACFLATKFSQLNDPTLGAIAGVVIWSAYFLTLAWVSSIAVGALTDTILRAATGGFRQLATAVTTAFYGQSNTSLSQEETIAIIQQEIKQTLTPAAISNLASQLIVGDSNQPGTYDSFKTPDPTIEEVNSYLGQKLAFYLRHTSLKQLTSDRIHRELNELLEEALENSGYRVEQLQLDQTQVKALLKERKGLTKQQRQQILKAVKAAWQQLVTPNATSTGDKRSENSKSSSLAAFQPITAYLADAVGKFENQLSDSDADLDRATIDQQQLPEKLTFSTAVTLAILQQLNQIDWDAVVHRLPLDDLIEKPIKHIADDMRSTVQELIGQPQQWTAAYLLPQTQGLKHQVSQQIEQFEQGLQARVATLKAQARERLNNTRQAAATAAWWLAATAFTTAVSAAIAGALAAGMPISMSLSF